MKVQRALTLLTVATLLITEACGKKQAMPVTYQYIHESDAAAIAIEDEQPFDIDIVWAEQISPHAALARYADPLIDAHPDWGRYMGIHVTEVDGSDHTVTLSIEVKNWRDGQPVFDYCRSVGVPPEALILLAPSTVVSAGTHNELKNKLFAQD